MNLNGASWQQSASSVTDIMLPSVTVLNMYSCSGVSSPDLYLAAAHSFEVVGHVCIEYCVCISCVVITAGEQSPTQQPSPQHCWSQHGGFSHPSV